MISVKDQQQINVCYTFWALQLYKYFISELVSDDGGYVICAYEGCVRSAIFISCDDRKKSEMFAASETSELFEMRYLIVIYFTCGR